MTKVNGPDRSWWRTATNDANNRLSVLDNQVSLSTKIQASHVSNAEVKAESR